MDITAADHAKCRECGHANYRHDRTVRTEDGNKASGCLVNWPRSGAVRGPAGACQCQRFVSKNVERVAIREAISAAVRDITDKGYEIDTNQTGFVFTKKEG